MRLIDADALKKHIKYTSDLGGWMGEVVTQIKLLAIKYIDDAPTIEPCEDAISREDAVKILWEWFPEYDEPMRKMKTLPSVAPSRPSGKWVDLFEEIGNTYDTIGDGQETEAFNRGLDACAEIVRRFFGLDMSKESE